MVKLNASPDMRYGVRLSNGVSKMGPRREILTIAIEAAKVGVEVARDSLRESRRLIGCIALN